jgi:DNA polymerase III epsilon subunit family exonuclease
MDTTVLILISFGVIVFLVIWLTLRGVGRTSHRSRVATIGGGEPGVSGSPRPDSDAVDLSSVPERFVVFDLETTGLDPIHDEIIEIGAIRVNRDSDVHETFESFVKPIKRISKKITRITGISQDMVDAEGDPLEIAIKDFAEFIEDLPLVSFNADFDMGFIQKAAKRHKILIQNPVSCALTMARLAWPGRISYQLCDIAKDGNLSDEGTHRALGDCKRTIFVYTGAASILAARLKRG